MSINVWVRFRIAKLTDSSARMDEVIVFWERFKSFKFDPNFASKYFIFVKFNGFYLDISYNYFDRIKTKKFPVIVTIIPVKSKEIRLEHLSAISFSNETVSANLVE